MILARLSCCSDLAASDFCVLSDGHLLEEDGQPHEEQRDDVGDEEGAAAVGVDDVGEAPHVADAHSQRQPGQQELQVAAPVAALRRRRVSLRHGPHRRHL